MKIMENLKEQIHNDFKPITFENWKLAAQKTLKNERIDEVINKNIIPNINISSIYDRNQVNKYFDLNFPSKVDGNQILSLSTITELPCESDLEVSVLLNLIKNTDENAAIELIIDPNFFLSVSKFRAVRYILTEMGREDITIIAKSSTQNKTFSDIENNIIRLTTEAMSAIIGGADKVDLVPYNSMRQNDAFGKRITDNIIILLNEESYLSKVKDPLSGSYLVENLTAKFIESVNLILFKLSEFVTESEKIDYILTSCSAFQNQQRELLDSQKKKIIGLNIYQNKKDNLGETNIKVTNNVLEFEALKSKIDKLNPKIYIVNFEEKNELQPSIALALNTYNITFQVSGIFELVEDAFNAIKLYDPDLVIVNGNNHIERILRNMLDEYNVINIDKFYNSSILKNIDKLVSSIGTSG